MLYRTRIASSAFRTKDLHRLTKRWKVFFKERTKSFSQLLEALVLRVAHAAHLRVKSEFVAHVMTARQLLGQAVGDCLANALGHL